MVDGLLVAQNSPVLDIVPELKAVFTVTAWVVPPVFEVHAVFPTLLTQYVVVDPGVTETELVEPIY